MTDLSIFDGAVRRLGRNAACADNLWLDWTGSGFEVQLKGSALWAEMEATSDDVSAWVCTTVDGVPVARFLVTRGRRWYPVFATTGAKFSRRVSLIKETQSTGNAVAVYGLRYEGELQPLPEPEMRIEFVGDSISSGEGALAPNGDDEYTPMWGSAVSNYTYYCAQALNAERRVLSRSGFGAVWDFVYRRENNMADGYRQIVGPQKDPASVARGCQAPHDFASWKPDVVVVKLLSNDIGGLNAASVPDKDALARELTDKAVAFAHTVRACNPDAPIVWLHPGTFSRLHWSTLTLARMCEEVPALYTMSVPERKPEEIGARNHPNDLYHKRLGLILADFIRAVLRDARPQA